MSEFIRPEVRPLVLRRLGIWKTILDEIHRMHVRHLAFLQPYRNMLGMTLAQQYGFSSELLDFSSDVRVAAFFACDDGPHYTFEGERLAQRLGTDVGVIFRLPSQAGQIRYERIDSRNYYTCPPQVHLADVCIRFEDKSSPEMSDQWTPRLVEEEMAVMVNGGTPLRFQSAIETELSMKRRMPIERAVDRYLALYYEPFAGNVRYFRLLDMEPGSFAASRLGRQNAVVVVPDELRETVRDPSQGDYTSFQAVEDVRHRDGCDVFFFRHSDEPPRFGGINREYLRPSHDCFKTMISRALDPSTEQYWFKEMTIPKRLDLVSTGFVASQIRM